MKKPSPGAWLWLFSLGGLALLFLRPLPARAGGDVTNCSQAALMAALAGGGEVIFTNDCEISLTNTIRLTNNVSLNANGYSVTIGTLYSTISETKTVTNRATIPITNVLFCFAYTNCTSVFNTNFSTTNFCFSNYNCMSDLLTTNIYRVCFSNYNCTNILGNEVCFAFTNNCTDIPLTNIPVYSNYVVSTTVTTHAVRLFEVASNVTVSFTSLTLEGGLSANGGALFIAPGASVFLTNCVFRTNFALGPNGLAGADGTVNSIGFGSDGGDGTSGGNGRGGAIYNLGDLRLYNCWFFTNHAVGGNGGNGGNGGSGDFQGGNNGRGGNGGAAYGGAIYNAGAVKLVDCSFTGNTVTGGSGGSGGNNGTNGVSGTNRTSAFPGLMGIGGAGAPGCGAGLYSVQDATVTNSIFSYNIGQGGNSAAGGTKPNGFGTDGPPGGGSLGGGVCSVAGSAEVTYCFFISNRVTGGNGGDGGPGVFYGGRGGDGGIGSGGGVYGFASVSILNCTLSQNAAQGGTNGNAGIGKWGNRDGSRGGSLGGNIATGGGTFTLKNSRMAAALAGGNGYGLITDAGDNSSSDSNPENTGPEIGSPGDNGSPTNDSPPELKATVGSNAVKNAKSAAVGSYSTGGTNKAGSATGATPVLMLAQAPPAPPPPAPGAGAARSPAVRSSGTGQVAAPVPAPPSQVVPRPGSPGLASPTPPGPASAPARTDGLVAINPPAGSAPAGLGPMTDAATNTFNFPAVDINQFLTIYAELIGRTILRPTSLPAPTITLKTQSPLTRKEALQAFDTLLAMNGISIIKVGDKFVKAVPSATAFQEGAPFSKMDPDALPETGQYDVHLVQLKYTKPSELAPVLQPFAKIPNSVLAIDSSQILVIRDYAENVRRMLEMIKQIDISVPAEFISEVIPIKYALASEISSALNSLSSGGGGGGTTVGRGTTGTGSRPSTGRPMTPGYPGGGMPGMPGGMGTQSPFGSSFGASGATGLGATGLGGTPAAGSSSFTDRLRSIIQKAGTSGDLQIIGQTKIIADERTNSLLIFATRQDMAMIKEIVAKLDVVLAQVIIEALIMEVSLGDAYDVGFTYIGKPKQIGNYFGGVGAIANTGLINQGSFAETGTSNATGGLLNGLTYFARFGQDFDATLSAVANDSRVNVLSRPRIQTSHAVPASIQVGVSRPIITGTYSYYSGSPQSQYQYQNFGITLNVTPLINVDGLVVMDIDQQVQSVGKEVKVDATVTMPEITTRSANAKVAVRNRETIILGGFISTQVNNAKSGVPILKDIPLLGYLFTSVKKQNDRGELIILIRPTVMQTPEIAAQVAAHERNLLPGIRRADAENQLQEQNLISKEIQREAAERRSKDAGQAAHETKEQEQVTEHTPAPGLEPAPKKTDAEAIKQSDPAADAARKAEEQRLSDEEARARVVEQLRKKAEAQAQEQAPAAAEAARKAEEERLAAEKVRAKAQVEKVQKQGEPDWERFNQVAPVTPEEKKALEAGKAPPP